MNKKPVYEFIVPANQPWSGVVKRGQSLRIVDLEGQQAVDTLFYRAGAFHERYSAQDTLRAQNSAYVVTGTRLISNEGNLMLTVTANTGGLHDTSAGACSCEANTVRFGQHTRYMHACRENFLVEVGKHGMSKRDIVSNINFFMNVPVEPDGRLAIVDGESRPGDYVEMLAAMDVLCVISNCPQINNPCNGFNPTPVQVLIFDHGQP
ncbi:MAG: urea amidolyase associated protein UAAP2 [Panacagrimonas sp.]